jgi:intein-encoded DNA endonuclease-like protein
LIKLENQLRYDTVDFLLSAKPGHFLAGLWDADGGVSYLSRGTLYVNVYLCQGENNLGLLRKIIDTLGKLGIKTSYRLSDRKHTLRKFYGKSYWLNENMYRLRVFKESVEDWIEVVGQKMMHPKKVERINQLRKLIKIYGDQ